MNFKKIHYVKWEKLTAVCILYFGNLFWREFFLKKS